ncbi:MAG: carboxypeptidase regulatory-like domain-containing protein, partial [Acidobacteriota bacterium]
MGVKGIVVAMSLGLLAGNDLGFRFTANVKRNPRSSVTITGQLIDARTFQPLRGAVVSAARVKDPRPDIPTNIGFRTGIDGRFILRGVAPGIVNFFVSKAGYPPGPYTSVRPAADGEQIDNVVLTVPPGASLGGRILDESGQPVAGASVMLQRANGVQVQPTMAPQPVRSMVSTDDDGRYWVGGLPAGEFTINVPGDPASFVFVGEDFARSGAPDPTTAAQATKVQVRSGEDRTVPDLVVRFRERFTGSRPLDYGTAVVAGRVTDAHGTGVAHASVVLRQSEKGGGTVATRADAAGRFQFQNVPGGSYSLGTPQLGLSTVTTIPTSTILQVASGSRTETVVLAAGRGGTISGVLTDEFGDPALGVVIVLTPMQLEQSGDSLSIVARPYLALVTGRAATADARGRYRLTTVPPGEYWVSVAMGDPVTARTDVHFVDSDGNDRQVVQGSVFYPGVMTASQASTVAVSEGTESSGIDLTVQPTLVAHINVTLASNRPVSEIQLHQILLDDRIPILEKTTKVAGSTVKLEARAGRYRLLASAEVASNADTVVRLWSSIDIEADPLLPAMVNMVLEPGANLSGRIAFEGKELNRQDAGAWLLPLAGIPGIRIPTIDGNSSLAVATGEFSIEGVMPGRYVIQAGGTDPRSPWMLKAAVIRGRDVLDEPIDLSTGEEIDDVRLTLTDRIGELSGRVADATDKPSRDDWVVVFSADRKHWYPGSRRTRVVRPDAKGTYLVRGLPAGSYLVALSREFLPRSLDLQQRLQTLTPTGVRVTLA